MKLVIDRSRWLRNVSKSELSCLIRRSDGKMCCLGFYGCALGFNPVMMENYGSPESQLLLDWPRWMLEVGDKTINSKDTRRLMTLNDDLGDEQGITEIFAKHGVEVIFVDGGGNA